MFKSLNVFQLMGWCSVFLGLSIVLGAFGSHALTMVLSIQKLEVFNKANHYLSIQSIGILVLLVFNNTLNRRISTKAIYSLIFGMLIFCMALYMVAFSEINGLSGLQKFGIIAPVGGLLMIAGWAIAAWNFFKGGSI